MGGMSPDYFKRQLRPYEAEQFIEGMEMRRRDEWERVRLTASPLYSKPIEFIWDKAEKAEKAERNEADESTAARLANVRDWADGIAKKLKKHG